MAKKSVYSGMGYVIADNRASDWGTVEETDLIGCAHCHGIMKKKAWQDNGGYCSNCDHAVCATCADRMLTHGCESFKRKIDQAVDTQYRQQQNARILGL